MLELFSKQIERAEAAVQRAQSNLEITQANIAVASAVLEKVTGTLAGLGLGKVEATLCKTGRSEDWEEGDTYRLAIVARPTNKKVKFIKDAGYDRQGRGRNQGRLQAAADRIEAALKPTAAEMYSVSVNQYSLEAKENDDNRVLIEVWTKRV